MLTYLQVYLPNVAGCLWYTNSSMPLIVCKEVPQQQNDYDCGLYMLRFIKVLV